MFSRCVAGTLQGPHEKRLLHHLLDKYNTLERPVSNESEPIQISFGITLMQIIDVVRMSFRGVGRRTHSRPKGGSITAAAARRKLGPSRIDRGIRHAAQLASNVAAGQSGAIDSIRHHHCRLRAMALVEHNARATSRDERNPAERRIWIHEPKSNDGAHTYKYSQYILYSYVYKAVRHCVAGFCGKRARNARRRFRFSLSVGRPISRRMFYLDTRDLARGICLRPASPRSTRIVAVRRPV